MYHITNAQLLLGILALALAVILAVRSILGDRKEKSTPFRNYFGPGYHRELLRHSDLSESDDWRSENGRRFTPFRIRGLETYRRNAKPTRENPLDRELD